jgi:hypothetical protein
MRKIYSTFVAAVFIAACTFGQASGDVALYDGPGGDDFFGSAPAGFRYNDIIVTDTGSSLIVDAPSDADGANGLFGGLGRDVAPVADIDANTALFRIVYRVLDDNTAGSFNFVLSDQDSASTAQDYQFGIVTSGGTPVGGGFVEQLLAITPGTEQFSAASFGFGAGDGTVDYGLRQWQVQSSFGSPDRLNIEIQSVSIVEPSAVPEPGSIALLGLGALGMVTRRRR